LEGGRSENLVDIVVEIHVAGTEVTTKHGGVSSEDSGYVDVARTTDNQPNTGDPLVKMCHQVRRTFYVLLELTNQHTHKITLSLT